MLPLFAELPIRWVFPPGCSRNRDWRQYTQDTTNNRQSSCACLKICNEDLRQTTPRILYLSIYIHALEAPPSCTHWRGVLLGSQCPYGREEKTGAPAGDKTRSLY
jgi:hypothetical protein